MMMTTESSKSHHASCSTTDDALPTPGFSASSIHQPPVACPERHLDPMGGGATMVTNNINNINNGNGHYHCNTTSLSSPPPHQMPMMMMTTDRSHSRGESYGGEGSSYNTTSSSYDREYNEQYYYQQMMDEAAHYAELQRQDEEYEQQLAELDVTLPQNQSSVSYYNQGINPSQQSVYYQQQQQQPEQQKKTEEHVHETADVEDKQDEQQNTTTEPPEEVVPRLPHIISWADDSDEAVDRAEHSNGSGSPPDGDADYFNISSTSDSLHANGSGSSGSGISPTKLAVGGNGSFGGLMLGSCTSAPAPPAFLLNDIPPSPPVVSGDTTMGQAEEQQHQDFSCPPTPTPSVCVSYCSGMPMQCHDFLDVEEQRALLADHQWRYHTTWCERLNEATRLSVPNRTVSLKVLVNEAYRLDKKHLMAKGATQEELQNLKSIWTSIGQEMVQEMEDPAANAALEGRLNSLGSPNQQTPSAAQQSQQFDNSPAVLRKFSAMAIFINGSSTGSRSYGENDEGRCSRQEMQERCLDALAYSGRLFF